MEPQDGQDVPDLRGLRVDLLRQAVDVYLSQAYAAVDPPEVVKRRLEWPAGVDAATLLSHPPFERASRPGPNRPAVYALRLGNARYPHMKLQIQPWPNVAGFMLSVNTHDQVLALDPAANDADAFRSLQAENQRLKEAIEQAWDQSGLPTFLRYLRDYINDNSAKSQ
ncbi:MAG TPA: hypothetical protein VGZ22_05690 [Isosphaeraceae bacterium]|jgi:hypothetical protein|nr:hypothetical protein [Isosphaeraceae bacterium]